MCGYLLYETGCILINKEFVEYWNQLHLNYFIAHTPSHQVTIQPDRVMNSHRLHTVQPIMNVPLHITVLLFIKNYRRM